MSKSIRLCTLFILFSFAGALVFFDYKDFHAHDRVRLVASESGLSVDAGTKPVPGPAAIAAAMQHFDIKLPPNVAFPEYDANYKQRGLLSFVNLILDLRKVTVGPAAFSSWGMLGSTLAHEIEVHAHQDLAIVMLIDFASGKNEGEAGAEREAYLYEIANAARFGLTVSEVEDIRWTMEEYYPDPKTGKISFFR